VTFLLDKFATPCYKVANSLKGCSMSLVPPTLPIAIAAKISGRSTAAIRALVADGTLAVVQGEVSRGISTAGLAAYLDREITPELYLSAERARDPARNYQRNYNHNRRTGKTGSDGRAAA
jgi:hypothetical protein